MAMTSADKKKKKDKNFSLTQCSFAGPKMGFYTEK